MISNSISNRAELRNFMTFDDFFLRHRQSLFLNKALLTSEASSRLNYVFYLHQFSIIAFPMRSRSGVRGVLWRFNGPINLLSRIAPARMGELLMAGEDDVKCIVKAIVGAVKCSMPSRRFKRELFQSIFACEIYGSKWSQIALERLRHHHRRIICVAMREISCVQSHQAENIRNLLDWKAGRIKFNSTENFVIKRRRRYAAKPGSAHNDVCAVSILN